MRGIELARRKGFEKVDTSTDSTAVKMYMEMEEVPWEVRKLVE